MSTSLQLDNHRVTGTVNLVRTNAEELRGKQIAVVIHMGPTGSGKSAFIESLSSDGTLVISKDSLESVTQEVVCYRLVNVVGIEPGSEAVVSVFMDTPGFLDTKLSESKISKMIWSELDALRKSAQWAAVTICYCHPITDVRLGGSKRDAVKLLRAFAESFQANNIIVITTMWNTLSTPKRIAGANERFEALQRHIPKQLKGLEVRISKFEGSYESALLALDQRYCGWVNTPDKPMRRLNPQFQALVLKNLVERINNSYQQLEQLAEDRRNAIKPGKEDHRLLGVLNRHEPGVLATLRSFLDEIYELDPDNCI